MARVCGVGGRERERGFEEDPRVWPEQLEGWSSFRPAGMLGAADLVILV